VQQAGIGTEHVDMSEFRTCGGDHPQYVGLDTDVGGHRDGRYGRTRGTISGLECGGQLAQCALLASDVSEDNASRLLMSKPMRQRTANTSGRASDDDRFAREFQATAPE
jgi:hypothetical protein